MILDVGCGGNFSQGCGKKNEDGFRPSTVKSDIAIDLRKPLVKRENFIQASAEALPFRDGVFDWAISFDVIEHVNGPVYMVSEMRRVAKKVLLVTPNAMHLPNTLMTMVRKSQRYEPHGDHVVAWSKAEMEGMFRRAGFKSYTVGFTNFHDHKAHWYIRLLMRFVPFPALRNRAFLVVAES